MSNTNARFDVDFIVRGLKNKELVPINYGRDMTSIDTMHSLAAILSSWENDTWYTPESIVVVLAETKTATAASSNSELGE